MKRRRFALILVLLIGAVSFPVTAQPIQPELLFSFLQGPSVPRGTLVLGGDGCFYGTTYSGGSSGYGSVFKVTTTGALTVLASFTDTNGAYPYAGLTPGNDGNFYGTTESGGSSSLGTVFRVTTNGMLTTLASFDPSIGAYPRAALTLGDDGNFYGTTVYGGSDASGTVFKVTTNGTLTRLVSFNSANGAMPFAGLTQGPDGHFYGTTYSGGNAGYGTIFRITTNGILTTLVSFGLTNGMGPGTALTMGNDGNFYGTTDGGGTFSSGTVFRVTTNGTLTTLVSFNMVNGSGPRSALTFGSDGRFYGTTQFGGSENRGTIFRITTTGILTSLLAFNGSNGDTPYAGLTLGVDNNFYGTTVGGGGSGYGTVFKMATNGSLTTIVSLGNSQGATPQAALTQASDGSLYGTTYAGGEYNFGTVFRFTTNSGLTTLLSFNGTNGSYPKEALIQSSDGGFYGTTLRGGTSDYGTVFKVTTNGTLTTLVSFDYNNGVQPNGLTLGNDGAFYGTTRSGGSSGAGTVFQLTTNGIINTLVSFDYNNGADPESGLTLGSDGVFYGTTYAINPGGNGSVFRVTTNGTLTTLASFNGVNGADPQAALAFGPDGNLYGTTSGGGANGYGTVFRITTNGTLTPLLSFNSAYGVQSALTLGTDGNLYGATQGDGAYGFGKLFQVTTNGILATFVNFAGPVGSSPNGLTLVGPGDFYGTTAAGGPGSLGTIFRVTALPPLFLNQPTPAQQTVPAGVSATINAHAFSTLPITYQWLFNDTNLPGATGDSLVLNNVSPSLSGNYALQASNRLGGPVLSSNVVLTVLPSIVATLPASGITATNAVLKGSVTLGPNETLAWFEWGTGTNYGEIDGITDIPGASGTVTLSNTLSGLNGDLIYHYRAVAWNSFGLAYGADQSFQVGVKPTALTLAATGLTTNTAALNATVNPGGRSTTVWFQWGASTNYGNLTPPTSVGHGATSLNFNDSIAGLALNTHYHCRVVASNSLGLATGADITFLIGPPLAVTGPATLVTGTNAWLNGWVTPNTLSTIAWFDWGTNTSYGNTVLLGMVGGGGASLLANSLLNNLDPAMTYHFRLVASNSLGVAFGADAPISLSLEAHAQSVLADQPLVYYRFDEASGTTALNYGTLGTSGDGTYNGNVSLGNSGLVPAFGFSAGFNNSNSMIAVPALGTNNQVTLEVWARPRSFGVTSPGNPSHSSYDSIYTADKYVPGALHTHFISFSSPNSIQWQVAINPSDYDIQFGNPGWFPSNSWVHLAVTHDSPAHRTVAYINGRAVFTNNASTTVPVNLAAAHIGNWIDAVNWGGAANWFDGQLDEFAIYTNVLSASRLQEHYQTAIGNPVLLSTQTTNRLNFSWAGPGFRLQSITNLSNPAGWTNVPAGSNSPVSVTISNTGNRFFRLKWP